MLIFTTLARIGEKVAAFRLMCCLNRHRPHEHRANWNGEHYVSRCEHCRKPIRRISQGKWVSDKDVIAHLDRPVGRPASRPAFAAR